MLDETDHFGVIFDHEDLHETNLGGLSESGRNAE